MKAELLHGFKQFDETNKLTPEVSSILQKMPLSSVFGMTPKSTTTATDESIICTTCAAAVEAMELYIPDHTRDEIVKLVVEVCSLVTEYSEEVCTEAVELHMVIEFHS
jgi:hypothetical protein